MNEWKFRVTHEKLGIDEEIVTKGVNVWTAFARAFEHACGFMAFKLGMADKVSTWSAYRFSGAKDGDKIEGLKIEMIVRVNKPGVRVKSKVKEQEEPVKPVEGHVPIFGGDLAKIYPPGHNGR